MSRAKAWVLDFGGRRSAAVGEGELVMMFHEPEIFPVPSAPRWCDSVLLWNEVAVPVMDMCARLGDAQPPVSKRKYVALVAYGAGAFGALAVQAPPVRADVEDSRACGLAALPDEWAGFANSAFREGESAVPILHLERVFGAAASRPAPSIAAGGASAAP